MDSTDEETLGKLQVVNTKHIVQSASEMFAVTPRNESTPAGDNISTNWYNIPNETRSRYWGHGITKGDELQQLIAVMTIAETSFVSGSTAPFASGGEIQPYTSGGALVLSRIDSELKQPDSEMVILDDGSGRTKDALKVSVGAIVLNANLAPYHEQLKSKYPNSVIIKADEIAAYVASEGGKV